MIFTPAYTGQYHFVNAIANQLRYPNAHTFFFMLYLLNLFSTCPPTSSIPERIARVLLERILAQRPHPFGLTLTMTTLLREPKFGFFDWPWARRENSPELWAIFQRVAGKVHA
jgi:CCR4-NOT transcription complex subunit 1